MNNRGESSSYKKKLLLLMFFFLFFIFYSTSFGDNEFFTYQVKKGDSLWSIAHLYKVSMQEIFRLNNLEERSILSIGQIIKIPNYTLPPPSTNQDYLFHKVKKGETLWSIAQHYHQKIDTLILLNNLANPDSISIGQQLKIPSSSSSIAGEEEKKDKNISEVKTTQQEENISPIVYTVKPGDSLWSISQKYGASTKLIAEINNLNPQSILRVGQSLEIPATGGGIESNEKNPEPTIIDYSVVKGDTLWSISRKFDVKMNLIISTNNLTEISRLSIGQVLKIPISNLNIAQAEGYNLESKTEDVIYYVKKGDSLWSIARDYNVKLDAIISVNHLSDASKISVGQRLLIPQTSEARNKIINFIWPVQGRITSNYGIRTFNGRREFHSGIDIGAPSGTNILAAESGTVGFSGYMRGYGNVIILSHENGYSTVYAHNSVNLVKKGQYVKKGNIIAKVGKTGNATGPHLHFEIRSSGKPLNPLSYLR
ncbi:MAG: hypothetical protein Kow00103_13490 [Candidatus Caldatribacteriota bacterium]